MGLNWIHNLSSALVGSAGPRPLTLSNLMEEMRSGDDPGSISARLGQLSQKMDLAGREARSDLESGRWSLDFATLLQRQVDLYHQLASTLQRLCQHSQWSLEECEGLASLGQQLARLAGQLEQDFRSGSPRCTGCGSQCGPYCEACGLRPLIWDALPEEYAEVPVSAGPTVQNLYWQLMGLLDGQCSFEQLEQGLDAFSLEIDPLRSADLAAVQELDQGLDSLYLGLETGRTRHLLDGWQHLCQGMSQLSQLA